MTNFAVPTATNPKIVTVAQMVALEQASPQHGVSIDNLMENAGLAVAKSARRLAGGGVAALRVLVLVGAGNNGADGLVTARHLQRWGARVTAYLLSGRPTPDPKMELALNYGIEVINGADDPDLSRLDGLLGRTGLVIDAVLGTGNSRPMAGAILLAMERVCQTRFWAKSPKLLALDLPSGLNGDTGAVDEACPVVDLTVALGRPKAGLLTFPGASHVGELEVAEIGIPEGLEEDKAIELELLANEWVGQRLPSRALNSHKGTFGHALVVAGSRNYVGAAYLAAQAAVRVGTGLVTLATPKSVYQIASTKLTEVIHLPLPEDDEGRVSPAGAEVIEEHLGRYDALLVGCGMGWSSSTAEFLEKLLLSNSSAGGGSSVVSSSSAQIPVIVDADGLNNLSGFGEWWHRLDRPTVVTPHPGEMATLTGVPTTELQKNRVESARQWASQWGVTLALKGAHTAVADPDGIVRLSPFSNPGLASGGTGDVLSGIIVGLLAQGLSPSDATCCGVFLHGHAGETVRQRLGESGMIASDLLEVLPVSLGVLRRAGMTYSGR